MTDYRALYGKEYIGAWDLPRDVTLTIARVKQGELRAPDTKKVDKRPIVYFEKTDKGLVLNVTNGRTIASMYGTTVEDWTGKRITLFATTTTFGRATVPCIRVRPKVPGKGGNALPETPPSETAIDEPAHEVAPEPSSLDSNDDGTVPGL